ncbi:MAG: Crp/Fnr family transcriptional regulator [Chloroflexi bacterium]|nr:Crp/Fnr family transcriptional regulator [Chloroflexota bacterium]
MPIDVAMLQNNALFKPLSVEALQKLADTAEARSLERGEFLFHQNAEQQSFWLVLKGVVRLVQMTTSGKSITLHTAIGGEPLAILFALIGEPFSGGAEAIEDSEIAVLSTALVWELIEAYPVVTLNILKMVAGRLREAHNRIRELSTEDVECRIARAVLRLIDKVGTPTKHGAVQLEMRLTRQDLAEMSGTTLETVSRTLKAWERMGIVQCHREKLTVLHIAEVTRIVEAGG